MAKNTHLLDTIRCSITFDNVNTFLTAFNIFKTEFGDRRRIDKQKGIIKCIVRIKNGFWN